MRSLYFLILLLIATGPIVSAQKDTSNTKALNVLFIGNSLTYTNDLPQLVETYAKQKGTPISTKMIALPNYSIEDHWNDGKVQTLIASKTYDFVIIQQGPSSQNDGRTMLMDFGKKYSDVCTQNEAKLCYFMVWPSLSNSHTFDGVIKNYTDAAHLNSAILLPVGMLWRDSIETNQSIDYYSADGFHPSIKGSELAAKVIVDTLLQQE